MTSSFCVLLLLCFGRVLYACDYTDCPDLPCSQPVRMPGQCCPVCPCERNGIYFDVGDLVRTDNDCETCECSKTGIECLDMPCFPPDCPYPVQGSDDCCPTCGCLFDGNVYDVGTEIYVRDPCKECRCGYDGRVMCRTERCPALECSNPRPVRGQCCKICGCRTRQGDEFPLGPIEPIDECIPCTCNSNGTITCIDPVCPAVTCSKKLQLIPDGECCPVCQCLFKNVYYSIGDEIPTNDPCETDCVCTEGGERMCAMMACPMIDCINPIYIRGQCCPQCGCEDKQTGVIHDFGLIQPVDDCNPCTCQEDGLIVCNPAICLDLPCSKKLQYMPPGECCPRCMCTLKQEVYHPGDEMPIPGYESCATSCACADDGSITCAHIECPAVSCTNPVTLPGECCPRCGCLSKKEIIPFGPILDDPCVECACTKDGTIQCGERQVCPNIKCISGYYKPPPDAPKECCKSCRCKVGKSIYKPGDTFDGPKCQSCKCQYSGRASCEAHHCPKVIECANPLLKKGDCCASCPDGPSCMYKKAVIPFGHFKEIGKLVCTCLGGNGTWFPNAFCAPQKLDQAAELLLPLLDEYGYEADEVDKDKKKQKKDKKKGKSGKN